MAHPAGGLESDSSEQKQGNLVVRYLLFGIGWISFSLGFIGAFLPILPTTPFMILAAYCFSRSSPRFHAWLYSLRAIGPVLKDFEEHRIIRLRAKILATTMIVLGMGYGLFFKEYSAMLKMLLLAIMTGVLFYIWSFRSTRNEEKFHSFKN